jgi:hypothetical protein
VFPLLPASLALLLLVQVGPQPQRVLPLLPAPHPPLLPFLAGVRPSQPLQPALPPSVVLQPHAATCDGPAKTAVARRGCSGSFSSSALPRQAPPARQRALLPGLLAVLPAVRLPEPQQEPVLALLRVKPVLPVPKMAQQPLGPLRVVPTVLLLRVVRLLLLRLP